MLHRRVLAIVVLLAAAAGCVKARAQAPVAPPSLTVPTPPDRVIVPAIPLPETVETPPAPVPSPAPVRNAPPTSRPADRPGASTTPPSSTPPPEPAGPPPQVLQTTTNSADLEQRARTQIGTAQRELDRINVRQLNANARTQYDSAKGFIRQAEDALRIKNFLLAGVLADKATSLARELARD